MSKSLIGCLSSALDAINAKSLNHLTSFTEKDVETVLAMQAALEAARLLCANLDNGGTGHQALVNHFRELDDLTKDA